MLKDSFVEVIFRFDFDDAEDDGEVKSKNSWSEECQQIGEYKIDVLTVFEHANKIS